MRTPQKSIPERIDELSQISVKAWVNLLVLLVFIFLTVVSTGSADLLIARGAINLPIINVSVSTTGFFIIAPILSTTLYVNLHLHLIKLWKAFGEAQPDRWNKQLSNQIYPSLINDFALSVKKGTTPRDVHRAFLRNAATVATVWIAHPAILILMWRKTLPISLSGVGFIIAGLLVCSCYVGFSSWMSCLGSLKDKDRTLKSKPVVVVMILTGFTVILAVISLFSSEIGATPPGRVLVPSLNLDGEALAYLPPEFRDKDRAKESFRTTWCSMEDVPIALCASLSARDIRLTNQVLLQRRSYCQNVLNWHGVAGSSRCLKLFFEMDRRFFQNWSVERRRQISETSDRIDFSNRIFVRFSARSASLVGATFARSYLYSGDLVDSNLEGGNFAGSNIRGARAFYGKFSYANMEEADLTDADLASADLEGANLRASLLAGANLIGANLANADLSGADLRHSNLRWAQLEGANFEGAVLDNANLSGAVGLTEAQLDTAIGNAETVLPPTSRRVGQVVWPLRLQVQSCWTNDEWLGKLLMNRHLSSKDRDALKNRKCDTGGPELTGKIAPRVGTP